MASDVYSFFPLYTFSITLYKSNGEGFVAYPQKSYTTVEQAVGSALFLT
jgi:hypothetical protein